MCIDVDSGALAPTVLSGMLCSALMLFGILYELDMLLPLLVTKLLDSHY
jgi:hypothetical protein